MRSFKIFVATIVLAIITIASAGPCEISLLEKFFIPSENQTLEILSAEGCKITSNPPNLRTAQQAKNIIDKNTTLTQSGDIIVYAKALQWEIKSMDNKTDFEMWLVEYPAQEMIVPEKISIPAGETIAIIVKDNIAVKGKRVNVYAVDNVNPPWTEATKGIERNGAVNASNTDEVVQRLSTGIANNITIIA